MQVAVIGAGSFGTVLADIAAHNQCDVKIYARRADLAEEINLYRRNSRYPVSYTHLTLPTILLV